MNEFSIYVIVTLVDV